MEALHTELMFHNQEFVNAEKIFWGKKELLSEWLM